MATLTDGLKTLLIRELDGFAREVELFPDDELLWKTVPGVTNSVGNLALHVCGNLQHFIGAVLGKTGYVRNREVEFGTRSGTRADVVREIRTTIAVVDRVLSALPDDAVARDYPEPVHGLALPAHRFLMHLSAHIAHHLGQAGYLRRILTVSESSGPLPLKALLQTVFLCALMVVAACGGGRQTADGQAAGPGVRADVAQAPSVPRAETVVNDAVSRARAEGKVVLIEFGASWCKWCTNFQNFVHSAEVGAIIADNYVVATLVVREDDPEMKKREHPGGAELMERWGGAESGLPFYVFLDVNGAKIADSNAMPGGKNIGFPFTREEVDRFMGLLDTTAPRLDADRRARVLTYLRKSGEA
jgi:thioredoxin-related protein